MNLSLVRKNKVFYLLSLVLLVLSFNFNVLGVGLSPTWFDNFDPTSEQLAHRTIDCENRGQYKGGVINVTGTEYCSVYPSQFGLQGYVYAGLSNVFPGERGKSAIILTMQLILSVLMALALMVFVLFAHIRYGLRVASLVLGMLAFSVWVVGYANQMYAVGFTVFLPFIFCLYFYPKIGESKKRTAMFAVVLFLSFLLKYLNGYEYLVAIALSAVAPMIYWELAQSSYSVKKIVTRAIGIISIALFAFMFAITLHVVSMVDNFGSLSKATSVIRDRGQARSADGVRESYTSTVYNFIDMQPELYGVIDKYKDVDALYDGKASPFTYIALMVFSYMVLPVVTLPIQLNGLIGVALESFVFWLVAACAILRLLRQRKIISTIESRAFSWLLTLGVLGIASWHILFLGHALVHEHIVGISYYVPTMLWVYLIIAIYIASVTRRYSTNTKGR